MTPAQILVVEDDRVVARDIAQQLTRIGHTVVGTTGRADEALALAIATKPTLVLMDIRLEDGGDGVDAAERIRAQTRLPVVFLTAYADDPTVFRASKVEPFGYLLKPFEDSQLRTAVEMALYRHAAEERLRESEHRFAVTLSSIADGVVTTDANDMIAFMNPVAEGLTGFPLAEAIGQPLSSVFRIVNDSTLVAKDGRHLAIDVSSAPVAHGGAVHVFRHMTPRRQVEQTEVLRIMNERMELALQGSDVAFWDFTLTDGTIETSTLTSQNFWRAYGYPVMPTDFKTVAAQWHPDDTERAMRTIHAYLNGETENYALEFRIRRHDGEYRTRIARGVAIRDATGKVLRFLGTSVDITERVQLANDLRASEEQYRNNFENAPIGIVHTCFEEWAILRVNQTYVNMTGWSREELVGPQGMNVIHPDDRVAVREKFDALRRGDISSYSAEFRTLCKNGSYIWVRITVTLSRDPSTNRRYSIAVVEDISERRRLERELMAAKEAAESSNRAKDEFLANVSHEIRTPMNAILGMTELVLDTALDAPQRQSLATVKSASTSLLAIIDDLLDFSKIEAGKMELDPIEFHLRELLGDTMRALAVRAQRNGLALDWSVPSETPDFLVGDAGRLRQVLMNLIGNAVKFTSQGEVRVDVTSQKTGGEVELRFAVRDTGIGIPKERQASIFRAFEQEDMSTTRKYGGTGLGLTIAMRLVEMMGGTITVASEPGRGSTFTASVRLRWLEGDSKAARNDASKAPRMSGPMRVLVAEDNAFNSMLIQQLLSRQGHSVTVARDGAEALEQARRGGFDLLLLDLHMPEIDGFQVIAQLREHERANGGHLPTIALTARSRAEDRARCFAAGMDDFLAKPIQAAALWAAIERIGHSDGVPPVPRPTTPTPTLVSADMLLATCGGDPVVLDAIRSGLHVRLPEGLAIIESAYRAGDAARLRESAHVMYGMLAAFSTTAGGVASTLEDVAAAGDLPAAGALISRLTALAPELLAAVDSVTIASLNAEAALLPGSALVAREAG